MVLRIRFVCWFNLSFTTAAKRAPTHTMPCEGITFLIVSEAVGVQLEDGLQPFAQHSC